MQNKQEQNNQAPAVKNKRLGLMLCVLVVGMFGFAFAMVPLYQLICSVTGINSISTNSGRTAASAVADTIVDTNRTVIVEFDVTLNSDIPFTVKPKFKRLVVHPGEAVETAYVVKNFSPDSIISQAVPGLTPWQATEYFHKTECFCFTQQTLLGFEEKEMGLRFVVDPELPKEMKVLTLSYTFMDTDRSENIDTSEPEQTHASLSL